MTLKRLLFISLILFLCSFFISFLFFKASFSSENDTRKPNHTAGLTQQEISKKIALQKIDKDVLSAETKIRLLIKENKNLLEICNAIKNKIEKENDAKEIMNLTADEAISEFLKSPSEKTYFTALKIVQKNPEKGLEAIFKKLEQNPGWKARHNLFLLISINNAHLTDEQLKTLLKLFQQEKHSITRSIILGVIYARKPASGIPLYRKLFNETEDIHIQRMMAGLLSFHGKKDAELWLHKEYKNAEKEADKRGLRGTISYYGTGKSLPLIQEFLDSCTEFSDDVPAYIKALVRIGDKSSLDFLREKIESTDDNIFRRVLKKAYNEIAKDEYYSF